MADVPTIVDSEQEAAAARRDPHCVRYQAAAAVAALNMGRPFAAEVHSDGTRYEMWIDATERQVASRGPGGEQLLPNGRLLVVLVNFGVAWHFSADSLWPYVAEKLRGTSEWDAAVVSLFVRTVFRYLEEAGRV